MNITSLAGLKAEIEKAVHRSLQREVFFVVRDTMQKNIDSTVYDVYEPRVYERRDTAGGIIATENIERVVAGTTLAVANMTPPNPSPRGATVNKYLPAVIEYGIWDKYDWPGHPYSDPRPFMANTREELAGSKQHVEALKAGLKRQGLNVK